MAEVYRGYQIVRKSTVAAVGSLSRDGSSFVVVNVQTGEQLNGRFSSLQSALDAIDEKSGPPLVEDGDDSAGM